MKESMQYLVIIIMDNGKVSLCIMVYIGWRSGTNTQKS